MAPALRTRLATGSFGLSVMVAMGTLLITVHPFAKKS
jgi:hypothetical protein